MLRELTLHKDFCLQAHLHVLVYVSVHADLVSEWSVCSLLTLRAWFSTFMMSSSCCFFLARVSWSLALTPLICTWNSITAGNSRRFTCYSSHENSHCVIYTSAFLCSDECTEEPEERWWCGIIWEKHCTHKAMRTRHAPWFAEPHGCLHFRLTNCS